VGGLGQLFCFPRKIVEFPIHFCLVYQNLTVVIKNRTLPWCILFSHFDQSTENSPYAFYTAYLNRNGTILLELSLFSAVMREVAVVVSACIDGLPRKLFISFW
jgi:hypothetical protein